MTPSMLELRAGRARVVIDPAGGGRIERLEVDGLALLVPPEVDDHGHGAFCMAPFAGRLIVSTMGPEADVMASGFSTIAVPAGDEEEEGEA